MRRGRRAGVGRAVPGAAAKPQPDSQQLLAHRAALTSTRPGQQFHQTFALAPGTWHEELHMKSKYWLLLTQGNSGRGRKRAESIQVGEEGEEKSRQRW